ncbi:hypothetical protein ACFX16_044162 [Malus domestica]
MAEDNPFSYENTSSSTSTPTNMIHGEINQNQRLCSVLLNDFNYLPWSRAVSFSLGERLKLGYVNGTIKPLESTSLSFNAWHQFVMSWILNSMEPKLSELFSYSGSSHLLWESVKEMYGSQNNAAHVFELKKSLAGLKQGDQSFVQHLGSLKSMWNELDLYRPHTTESDVLLKKANEDKVFELLASLGAEYEDLRSNLLMTPELPSFISVCHAIQREETRRKVMHIEPKFSSEARVFTSNHKNFGERVFNGKKADWKCTYCNIKGHLREKCWILHLELKPKFDKEGKMIKDGKWFAPKALRATSCLADEMANFTSNPISLINEFAAFLQRKNETIENEKMIIENSTAMLGKFVGFLAGSDTTTHGNIPRSSHSEED